MIGSVYLLCDPSTGLFKIGMTRSHVSKRMKELQTGNSCEIHLVDKYDTEIPFHIETTLHHIFIEKHELNEWYALDVEDLRNFSDICKKIESDAKALKGNPFFDPK